MPNVKMIVAPDRGRGWTVSRAGDGAVATARTQRDAVAAAREQLASAGGGELEIRGRDGRIREARTLGAPENRRSPG